MSQIFSPQNWITQNELLLVDKPVGPSSNQVLTTLKKLPALQPLKGNAKRIKMGHAGTLDPFASGLLIVGIGQGTKQMTQFLKLPKTYEATICVGRHTTTLDPEGDILEEENIESFSIQQMKQATQVLKEMVGKHEWQVPLYSAIKVDGKALYAYAREQKTPPRIPIKEMEIKSIKVNEITHDESVQKVFITITCEVVSGTYIRTIAEQFGKRFKKPAMLTQLRRTHIAQHSVENAYKIS